MDLETYYYRRAGPQRFGTKTIVHRTMPEEQRQRNGVDADQNNCQTSHTGEPQSFGELGSLLRPFRVKCWGPDVLEAAVIAVNKHQLRLNDASSHGLLMELLIGCS